MSELSLNGNQELKEPLKTTLLYSYVNKIKEELESKKEKTVLEFKTLVFQKMALAALTSSGGWFLLSGDETCDSTAKTVFQRKGAVDKSYYPQRDHRIFTDQPAAAIWLRRRDDLPCRQPQF